MGMMRTVAAVALGFAVLTTAGCMDSAAKGTVSDASGAKGAPAAEAAKNVDDAPATWGKRYTWPDGLAVEVAKPVTCKPSQFSMPQHPARAVKVTVLVVNGTKKNFDPMLLTSADAQFDQAQADALYDTDGGCDSSALNSATVLPGKTFKLTLAFVVGKQPGEFQLALQPDFGAEKAVFVGQA